MTVSPVVGLMPISVEILIVAIIGVGTGVSAVAIAWALLSSDSER